MNDLAAPAVPGREGLLDRPAFLTVSVLAILGASAPLSMVNAFAGLVGLGGGLSLLAYLRKDEPADVIGLLLIAFAASPFLRRIHDFSQGWNPFSVILVAPYVLLVPLAMVVLKNLPQLRRQPLVPLIPVLAGLLWAFLVGVWNFGIPSAVIGAVEWTSGPLILLYMLLCGKPFRYHRFGVWLSWIIVVEVAYGIFQWASPPPWDAKWLVDSNMTSSMGIPEPFLMRTFGTLNSTGIYSFVCAFYLIAGVRWKGYLFLAIPTIAALATTQVRAAWIIAVLGILIALVLQPGRARWGMLLRLTIIGGVLGVFAVPLASKYGNLGKRFETLGNISSDGSYHDRSRLVDAAIETLINLPQGAGLGSVGRGAKVTGNGIEGLDNGFIAVTYMMGWMGAACYLGGFLVMAGMSIFMGNPNRPERAAMGGLVLVLFLSNAFGPSFSDIGGIISWSSVGIGYLGIFHPPRSLGAARRGLPV